MKIMPLVIAALVVVIVIVLLLILLIVIDQNAAQKPPVVLEEGPYQWTIYIGGSPNVWYLKYQHYGDLPINPADFNRIVQFKGVSYRLWRVWEGQLQVSPPIS